MRVDEGSKVMEKKFSRGENDGTYCRSGRGTRATRYRFTFFFGYFVFVNDRSSLTQNRREKKTPFCLFDMILVVYELFAMAFFIRQQVLFSSPSNQFLGSDMSQAPKLRGSVEKKKTW